MRRLTAPLLLAAALAGCGGGDAEEAGTPAPAPTATAAASDGGGGAPFVSSLAVDPGDGTLLAGTGLGLYRVAPGATRGKPFTGELTTPDGSGAISANVVLRFTGPDELLGSGHPADADSGLPEFLGLIRSADGGAEWESVSLLGDEDLHALDAQGDVVAGHPMDETRVVVSERRRPLVRGAHPAGHAGRRRPGPGRSAADRPDDGRRPLRVARRGGSWRQRDVLTVETFLAWSPDGPLYRVDASGAVKVSGDGGEGWEDAGNAGAGPTAFTVDAEGALYVALAGAVIVRSEDGGKSFSELARLSSG